MGDGIIETLWNSIQLGDALSDMVGGVTSQVGSLLPTGILLMFALAVPRIVKRIIGIFL